MNEAAIFGQLVRETRKARKVRLEQLAEKTRTGVKHLGRIERGEKQPSFELIVALAEAMNVSPSVFFHFENARVDDDALREQITRLLNHRETEELRKAVRVLEAILEP